MSNDWHSQLNSAWKLKKASLEPAVKETSEMGNATSSNGTNSVAANLEERGVSDILCKRGFSC